MLASLADRISSRPRRTLAGVLVFVVLAAVLGGQVFTTLDAGSGDFVPKSAESTAALDRIEGATGVAASPGAILIQEGGREQAAALERELRAEEGVAAVVSAASGDPRFVSDDGRSTYLAVTFEAGADEDAVAEELLARYGDRDGVQVGGGAVAQVQLSEQVSKDLGRAEMFAFPLLLALSLLFFRGGRAALLPLLVGMTTVLGTFLVLLAVNGVYDLSIFAVNLVIGLGLGLAIDYTLFLLTRYRQEAERHGPTPAALRATMSTAGRTVAYSSATVAVALATLTVFPLGFLQSMGIGGAAVATVAAVASLVITPALLTVWGPKLAGAQRASDATAHGRWYRVAHGVMRRPGIIAAVTATVMVALTLPALRANWTPVDATAMPRDLSARQVSDRLAAEFPREDSGAILAVLDAPRSASADVGAFAREAATIDAVRAVGEPRFLGESTWQVDVVPRGSGTGEAARAVVADLRSEVPRLDVLVGGEAAEFTDQQDAIGSRLPVAVALLALLTFALLWLMTGSVVLPAKALVMNVLTVGATLGALTLVFQDGRFEDFLGYTANGGIEPADFLITAALVFALSTDYGVFLLGRIKEARDSGLPDREAVAVGLASTGRVVTAAAILLAVAIGAFVTSGVLFIKQIGIGTAFGVMIDAFVVRALLVPALMAMLGRWNWWSPQILSRLHRRVAPAPEGAAA